MFWFLLGWWFGSAKHDEPERPRYFKEPKPRELTKEEQARMLTTVIFLLIGILVIYALALVCYNDIIFRLLQQISHAIH